MANVENPSSFGRLKSQISCVSWKIQKIKQLVRYSPFSSVRRRNFGVWPLCVFVFWTSEKMFYPKKVLCSMLRKYSEKRRITTIACLSASGKDNYDFIKRINGISSAQCEIHCEDKLWMEQNKLWMESMSFWGQPSRKIRRSGGLSSIGFPVEQNLPQNRKIFDILFLAEETLPLFSYILVWLRSNLKGKWILTPVFPAHFPTHFPQGILWPNRLYSGRTFLS